MKWRSAERLTCQGFGRGTTAQWIRCRGGHGVVLYQSISNLKYFLWGGHFLRELWFPPCLTEKISNWADLCPGLDDSADGGAQISCRLWPCLGSTWRERRGLRTSSWTATFVLDVGDGCIGLFLQNLWHPFNLNWSWGTVMYACIYNTYYMYIYDMYIYIYNMYR